MHVRTVQMLPSAPCKESESLYWVCCIPVALRNKYVLCPAVRFLWCFRASGAATFLALLRRVCATTGCGLLLPLLMKPPVSKQLTSRRHCLVMVASTRTSSDKQRRRCSASPKSHHPLHSCEAQNPSSSSVVVKHGGRIVVQFLCIYSACQDAFMSHACSTHKHHERVNIAFHTVHTTNGQ